MMKTTDDYPKVTEEEIRTYRESALYRDVKKHRIETIENIYKLIANREVDRTLEGVYASKRWCAEIISGRAPTKIKQICKKRGVEKAELVEMAKSQLLSSFEEHKKNQRESAKKTIEEYANYLVDVSIFWSDAKARLELEVSRVENSIIRLAKNGKYEKAKRLFEKAKQVRPDRTLGDLPKVLEDIIVQVRGL